MENPSSSATDSRGFFNKLKSPSQFSRLQKGLFILVFVVVGPLLIFSSFAASPLVATLQAEQMNLPTGTSIITDSSSSSGKAIQMNYNGATTGTVSFPSSVNSVTVMAKGAQCNGAPSMTVALDSANILANTSVSATGWTAYTYSPGTAIATGSHSLSIQFTNAYSSAGHGKHGRGGCARTLFVDVINFYGPTTSPPPTTVTLDASPPAVNAGQSSTLTWTSTNATSCTASGAWSGNVPTSGTTSTGALNNSSTYTLTCYGNGSDKKTASVSVNSPTSVHIDASLTSISSGQSSMLTWTSTNATSCTASDAWSGSQATSGSKSVSPTTTSTYTLTCTGSGGSSTDRTTISVGSVSNVLFEDQFNGAAGSAPDPNKWILHDENCAEVATWSCIKNSNTFLDGAGNLVLRTKRESTNYKTGGPFSGAWVDTFKYGWGWPASVVKASWAVPYHIEMRAKMPPTPGAWPAGWNMNVDRSTSQNNYELDWAEERMTYPTSAGCHQHTWLSGSDKQPWDGGIGVSDMGKNFHVYSADVYADHVNYRVDGILCGASYGISGTQGLLLDNVIARPSSWGSGGGQPVVSDPGPWDFVIDYIRVNKLN